MNKKHCLSLVATAVCAALATPVFAGSYQVDGVDQSQNPIDSLQAAFDAVQGGKKVTILGDSEGNGAIATKNFTLDLNGHIYTFKGEAVGSSGTETNGLQLLKDNTITIQNGKINVSTDNVSTQKPFLSKLGSGAP